MFVIRFQQNPPWLKMEVCFRRSLFWSGISANREGEGDRILGIEKVRSRGSPGICRGGFSRLILTCVIRFQQNPPWLKMEVCFRRSLFWSGISAKWEGEGDRTLGIEEVRSRGSPGICRGGFSRLISMLVITFQQNPPWLKMGVCFRRSHPGNRESAITINAIYPITSLKVDVITWIPIISFPTEWRDTSLEM